MKVSIISNLEGRMRAAAGRHLCFDGGGSPGVSLMVRARARRVARRLFTTRGALRARCGRSPGSCASRESTDVVCCAFSLAEDAWRYKCQGRRPRRVVLVSYVSATRRGPLCLGFSVRACVCSRDLLRVLPVQTTSRHRCGGKAGDPVASKREHRNLASVLLALASTCRRASK